MICINTDKVSGLFSLIIDEVFSLTSELNYLKKTCPFLTVNLPILRFNIILSPFLIKRAYTYLKERFYNS